LSVFSRPPKKEKKWKKSHYCYLSSMPVKRRHTKKVTEEEPTTLLAAEIPSKKWRNWWIRTITTFIMIGMFFIILASGYIWSIVMVMIITMLVYREVIQIAHYSARSNLSWFKTMSW
jgi:phosphatidate cytidylyltransferase